MNDEKILLGRTAVVTGGNQGLGFEIARQFVLAGCNVLICARGQTELEAAERELDTLIGTGQEVIAIPADVSNKDDVEKIHDVALTNFGTVQILVNNAGIYGPKGPFSTNKWEEFDRAIQINLKGSLLMAKAFIPEFESNNYGKIIQLSGGGATKPLPNLSSYATTKAAIVRFAETLSVELKDKGIDVNSIAPGALNTRMLEEILEAGPKRVGEDFYRQAQKQKQDGGTDLGVAAGLAVFLASAQSDGITGKLISAAWDKWREWPNHLDELNSSDAYTLRRITGRDRGFDWGDI